MKQAEIIITPLALDGEGKVVVMIRENRIDTSFVTDKTPEQLLSYGQRFINIAQELFALQNGNKATDLQG